MSSLNVKPRDPDGWSAFPGPETTIAQIVQAAVAFPQLEVVFYRSSSEIAFVSRDNVDAPTAEELAAALFGDDAELIVSEDTGTFELPDAMDLYDQEARDRHFEEDQDETGLQENIDAFMSEDADREMIGDDVDLGINNIGNK